MNEETLNTQNEIDKEGIDSIQNLIEKDAEKKDQTERKKPVSLHATAGLRFPVTRIRNAMKL